MAILELGQQRFLSSAITGRGPISFLSSPLNPHSGIILSSDWISIKKACIVFPFKNLEMWTYLHVCFNHGSLFGRQSMRINWADVKHHTVTFIWSSDYFMRVLIVTYHHSTGFQLCIGLQYLSWKDPTRSELICNWQREKDLFECAILYSDNKIMIYMPLIFFKMDITYSADVSFHFS